MDESGWQRVTGVSWSVVTVEARHQSYSSALTDACMNGSCCRCRCCVPEVEAEADKEADGVRPEGAGATLSRTRCQKSEPERSTPQRKLLHLPL